MEWQLIETAPKNEPILVYYDHDVAPYHDAESSSKLSPYYAWEDSGQLQGCGICVAQWVPQTWESTDEYGTGFWMPGWWFSRINDDSQTALYPTHWMPLPEPPQPTKEQEK